jgi:hypothetical protein
VTTAVFSVLAEIEWKFEGDDDVNWIFLVQRAAFSHREACEFLLHVGTSEDRHWEHVERQMREHGCTDDFIAAYLEAKDAGAMRVLYWS